MTTPSAWRPEWCVVGGGTWRDYRDLPQALARCPHLWARPGDGPEGQAESLLVLLTLHLQTAHGRCHSMNDK